MPCPKTGFFQDRCLVCPHLHSVLWLNPDAATITAVNLALQRLSAGPFHSIPSALLRRGSACGLKIDVDGIQLASKAAHLRVASQYGVLSAGMARIRAARDYDGRTLGSCARS